MTVTSLTNPWADANDVSAAEEYRVRRNTHTCSVEHFSVHSGSSQVCPTFEIYKHTLYLTHTDAHFS